MLTMTLPEFTGVRPEQIGIVEDLPRDLTGVDVFVEASGTQTSVQSFANGLVYHTLDLRKVRRLTVSNPTIKFAQEMIRSAKAAGLEERLFIRMTG